MPTPQERAATLIEALPYMQKFAGETLVIKYGGHAMLTPELKHAVMEDIILLKYAGMNPVLVHGGGPDLTAALTQLNIPSEFVHGLRVTGPEVMAAAQMVFIGKTNQDIVALMNSKGGRAIGLSGIDGSLLACEKLLLEHAGQELDLGFVGKITGVNAPLITQLAGAGYIPVIAPVGIGSGGERYNINADTVAAEVAVALGAAKLILLTDVPGVKGAASEATLPLLTPTTARRLIDEGVITKGMIPKVQGAVDALQRGVGNVHIIDGRVPHCLLLEIFTDRGVGTMFAAD